MSTMIAGPFLTDIDPQAAIKGSRDPLGIQPIWTRLGRHVVGNLTTVSSSVRDFTTTILGYYFAERVANEEGGDSDLAVFLRWEQLASYARGGINNDWEFRGTERAKKNFNALPVIARPQQSPRKCAEEKGQVPDSVRIDARSRGPSAIKAENVGSQVGLRTHKK